MLTVIPIQTGEQELVTAQDLLTVIEQNRARVRALGGMIISVCGMLVSASFVVLFFLLREGRSSVSVAVLVPLALSLALLGAAIVFSILAGFIPAPVAPTTRLQLVDIVAASFRRERRHAKSAVALLLIAMVMLAATIAALSAGAFATPANPPLQPTCAPPK
jgi:hypothetical protein